MADNEEELDSTPEDVELSEKPGLEGVKEDLRSVFEAKEETEDASETPAQAAARQRDEHGRFKPKEEATEVPKGRTRQTAPAELEAKETRIRQGKPSLPAATAPGADIPMPAGRQAVEGAPSSFRPISREQWAALPQELKEDIHRREQETYALFEKSKGERQFLSQLSQETAPYQAIMQAEGGNVITSLRSYLQAATLMRTGSPQVKANWVADLVTNFGVPLEMLDQALSAKVNGGPGLQAPNGQPQQYRDPRVDQMLAQQQAQTNQRINESYEYEQQAVGEFKQDKEFFDYVRNDMADLIELAAKNRREMSYEQAYEIAIRANPEVYRVVQQREQAASARANSVQRSRRASVSLRPNAPPPSGVSSSGSLKDDLRASLEDVMGA